MCKFQFKLFSLIFLTLIGADALAESNSLGGSFFGFNRNTVVASSDLPKDVLHERQAKKTAVLSKEKKAEIARSEQRKESDQPNSGNQNSTLKKNRMTLEERRALRRQIHDAGNEVYVLPK